MNEMLRKEPTIAPRDDIPVLHDRINVSWEKLSRIVEPVVQVAPQPTFQPMGFATAPKPRLTDEEIIREVVTRVVPAVNARIAEQLDDVLTLALNNTYQRLRSDLHHQLGALVNEAVREEAQRALRDYPHEVN